MPPMLEPKLSYCVDPLREMLYQHDMIIRRFREESGALVAGVTCDMFPAEITASLGLVPLRIPSGIAGHCTAAVLPSVGDAGLYDVLIVPRGCAGRKGATEPSAVHEFYCPPGWGEETWRPMEDALNDLLVSRDLPGLSALDPQRLSAVTAGYNAVRRMVRGIASARGEKPGLLSCRDLGVVMDAAMVFPPPVVAEFLSAILEALNREEAAAGRKPAAALVYASFACDAEVLDDIEAAGCLFVEDDTCGGRRQFDMSYNHESPDLFREIIDAYSYRPRCPSVRTVEERTALLYSMIKSRGIELVVFIEDLCCPAKKRDIDALRVRLMRSGVDPLVVSTEGAVEAVKEYIKRM